MLSLRGTGFLLSALCERLDLCLPPEDRRLLHEQAPPDAASFTAAVFAAKGLDAASADRTRYQDALTLAEQVYADHGRADS